MQLFVSYAHADEVRVAEFAELFRAGGFDPWWDDRLEPGDNWKIELRKRIAACDAFLCMLSTDYVEAEWCRWELDRAAELQKPIVPIVLRAGTKIPSVLSQLQYLDASSGLRSLDVAKLVGKLARLKQYFSPNTVDENEVPEGLPSRFKRPLPRNYRTIAQAYLQPLSRDMRLFRWQPETIRELPPSDHIIGVDFGTTLSSAAVYRNETSELIPNFFGETLTLSAVAISPDGIPLVGQRAFDLILTRPERGVLEVKRLFGQDLLKEFEGPPVLEVDGTAYTPAHLAAFLLRELRRDAESYLQSSVDRAVITAPAYFDQSQYASLMQAADFAGFKVMRVLTEPVAACMGAGLTSTEEKRALVYDLGGGTFDVSIIERWERIFEVKAVNGDTLLGGADFDRAIVDYCVEKFRDETGVNLGSNASALIRIREAAERAKIALSSQPNVRVSVPFIAVAGSKVLHLDEEVTRTRFNELTHNLVSRTVTLSRTVLEDADTSPERIDDVLVVGRASRALSVRLALSDLFGERLRFAPDHVVSLGAAIQGAILSGDLTESLLLDSIAHTLRLQVCGGRSIPVIIRNTIFPTLTKLALTPKEKDGIMLVRVVAGETSRIEQNLILTELQVPIGQLSDASPQVQVTFDIDANSHLKVSAAGFDGTTLSETSVGLRQHAKREVSLLQPTASQDESLLPIATSNPKTPPFPEGCDLKDPSLQRWIYRAATDLFLWPVKHMKPISLRKWKWLELDTWLDSHPTAEVPARFTDQIFHIPEFEREILVDAIEPHVPFDLGQLRTCSSIETLYKRLITIMEQH